MITAAAFDNLLANVNPNLMDDAQDVPFRCRRIWPQDKIRASQGVEVNRVVSHKECGIKQLSQFLDR